MVMKINVKILLSTYEIMLSFSEFPILFIKSLSFDYKIKLVFTHCIIFINIF